MKTILVCLSLATLSFSAFASVPTTRCLAQAQESVQNLDIPSDHPLSIENTEKGILLKAGETDAIFGTQIGPFETTKVIYQVSGSVQSGYFVNALLFDAKNCKFDEMINLYSE